MPLAPNALALIRSNLEAIQNGKWVTPIVIGALTDLQLNAINQERLTRTNPLPPLISEVLFLGRHIYKSRIERDGYTIEDVLLQIESAMDARSVVLHSPKMGTVITNPNLRQDRFGNTIRDEAVFECTTRHPRPELFSVIPKGDTIRPPRK